MAKAGGHLFIINGDVQKLACDAWLLPTDEYLTVTPSFADAIQDRVAPYDDGDFKVENFTWDGLAIGICKEAVDACAHVEVTVAPPLDVVRFWIICSMVMSGTRDLREKNYVFTRFTMFAPATPA